MTPTDDATCGITLTSTSQTPGEVDYETAKNFKDAAFILVNECVVKQGLGGVLRGLGHNDSAYLLLPV